MQGKVINGFELKSSLGRGGMAEVWYAENEIGKPAAVKVLKEDLSHNEQLVDRFRNEAIVMVKLDHPNIRQVYGYGTIDDRPCIVMEYLEGNDLKALMKQGRHFTDVELKKWWNQLVDALNYTHAQGIIHRDIKPSNIFIDKKGDVKLLDFGIAKVKESITLTETFAMLGTLIYMSPEQVQDSKHLDYRTDVYSLAVTFIHLLTGKAPYDNTTSNDYAIRKGIVEQELDLSALPASWRGFLKPYLAKEPANRPELRHFEPVQPQEEEEELATKEIDEGTLVGLVPTPLEPAPKKEEQPKPKEEQPKKEKKLKLQKEKKTEPKEKPEAKAPSSQAKKGGKKKWIILIAGIVVVAVVVGILLLRPSYQEKEFKEDLSFAESLWDEYQIMSPMEDYSENIYWLSASYNACKVANSGFYAIKNHDSKKWLEKKQRCESVRSMCIDNVMQMLKIEFEKFDTDEDPIPIVKRIRQLEEFDYIRYDEDNLSDSIYYQRQLPLRDSIEKAIKEKIGGDVISIKDTDVSFLMKKVDGGTFQMGCNDKDASKDEKPVHSVTLSSFYMGETEVTQALWQAVMGSNPSHFKGDNLPVEGMSYKDIVNGFLPKLNSLTGKEFRLPTEAEWEYAARGGVHSNGYKYAGSDNVDDVAWYSVNSYNTPHVVKAKVPNELGLYDMSGNVWEWCQDWYGSDYYGKSPSTNPQGPSSGSNNCHVLRGGSWSIKAMFCRVSDRSDLLILGPTSSNCNGFRLALSE